MSMIDRQHAFIREGHAARMSPTQALVWIILNDHSDPHGDAFPATETIAAELGHAKNATTGRADTKAVRRALVWLQANGYVQMIDPSTFRRSAIYRVLVPSGDVQPPTEGNPPTVGTLPTQNKPESIAQSGQCAPPRVGNAPRPQWAHCPPKMTFKSTEKSTHTARAIFFDRFWEALPACKRDVGRSRARGLWERLQLDDVADQVLDGLKRWQATPKWKEQGGRFHKSAIEFLENRLWEDAPTASAPPPARTAAAKIDPNAAHRAEIERDRAAVNLALAGLDRHALELRKQEVIAMQGDGGSLMYGKADPTDTSSAKGNALRALIAQLLTRTRPAMSIAV